MREEEKVLLLNLCKIFVTLPRFLVPTVCVRTKIK